MLSGVAAAAAMALVTMVAAATVLDLGLYTPIYLVTAIVEPGFAVHLGIGAGFGALFALLARALRLRGVVAVLAGVVYGLAVMALMGLVLIPSLAGETAGDQLIADAPALIGWPVATVAHLVFGLVLGVWPAVAARDRAPAEDAAPRRQQGKPVS